MTRSVFWLHQPFIETASCVEHGDADFSVAHLYGFLLASDRVDVGCRPDIQSCITILWTRRRGSLYGGGCRDVCHLPFCMELVELLVDHFPVGGAERAHLAA